MDQSTRLTQIEKSLVGVISAITQTPGKKVRHARLASTIATAKVTGVVTTAGIWGLVSTLGTAGTGTAIGTLSGAASTSATLAWIGGLVGGGMAAGAVILPIAGITVGAAASMYVRRKLYDRPRKLENLHPFEDEILFGADKLIHPLETISKEGAVPPTADELRIYAHDGLKPLIEQIEQHLGEVGASASENSAVAVFSNTLKPKYQRQLQKHCNRLQKHANVLGKPRRKPVLERLGIGVTKAFKRQKKGQLKPQSLPKLGSVVLAVTFQRLLEDKLTALSLENNLVLDALRRSTGRLENASVDELSDYIRDLSPEQITGVVANTKGIYHELLFVEMHNAMGVETSAQVMEATNFPGADVQFILEGEVVREVQLKAVNSPTLVYEHLERYPDIEILVTEETAAMLDGIDSSGLSNAILSQDVSERMNQLQGEGLFDNISDGLITSAFVVSGFALWSVFSRKDSQAFDFKPCLASAGIAVGATTMIESVVALAGN